MKDFIKLIRIQNILIVTITQLFVRVFIVGDKTQWRDYLIDYQLYILLSCTAFITASGYIINDYYDIKIDVINKPNKVFIGRKIKRRTALLLQIVFNCLAIGIGVILHWKLGLFFFLSALLLWLYSNSLKRMPLVGNITVAILSALSIYLLEFYYQSKDPTIILFCFFAFIISMIREIIKDLEDIEGDIKHGCKTLPIQFGVRKTKIFTLSLILLFIASVLILTSSNAALQGYMICFVLPPTLVLFYLLYRADKKRDFSMLSSLCKIIILCGIFAMAMA